ncbi:MAG: NifU family protein [Polyangiaceae bacterium]|jgi:Fe-S cluster biogenesis protein NfuA
MDDAQRNDVLRVCRDILAPLVRVDGGDLHLVRFEEEEISLHLTGTCSGCPGVAMTRDDLFVPALRAVASQIRVVVTTGFPMPDGAEKL